MSDDEKPKRKPPQPTIQWDPEAPHLSGQDDVPPEEPASGESGDRGAADAPPAGGAAGDAPRGLGSPAAPQAGSPAQPAAESPAPPQAGSPAQPAAESPAAPMAGPPAQPAAGLPPAPPEGDSDDDPLIGQLLRGKWRVLKKLGAGSFGTVYKVQDVNGGWIEALKILGIDRIMGAEAENIRARFLREAQIMKRLGSRSPHIVGLSTYEEDVEAGLVYFLMEYVDGRSLGDILMDEGPFPLEKTVRIALQVCEALIVAHEGEDGVVHRDLKLENVMITLDRSGNEVAKVLDFGIAKVAEREADSRLTTVGTLGTPGYAAPEQLRAEAVDARTDLFSFGVILYALLTGRDPWLGHRAGESTSQVYELMVATERAEVRPIAGTGVDVPPAMANIVLRLLRRDPDDRFSSAGELKEALLRIADGGAALDAASLRVRTDDPGVALAVIQGRRVVAEGPSPLAANGLEPGSYRIQLRDPRFQASETTVILAPGSMEEVTLVTTLRSGGARSQPPRRIAPIAAAAVVVLLLAGALLVQPWGRSLDLGEMTAYAAEGRITEVRLSERGIEGRLAIGPVPAPVRVPVPGERYAEVVAELRGAGLSVDTSREVRRLIDLAVAAQSRSRYFGREGEDVRGFAQQAAVLDPASAEARSLLLKVAERMAWDAEAARRDDAPERAEELLRECLRIVPGHAACLAAGAGEG